MADQNTSETIRIRMRWTTTVIDRSGQGLETSLVIVMVIGVVIEGHLVIVHSLEKERGNDIGVAESIETGTRIERRETAKRKRGTKIGRGTAIWIEENVILIEENVIVTGKGKGSRRGKWNVHVEAGVDPKERGAGIRNLKREKGIGSLKNGTEKAGTFFVLL